MLLLRRWIFRFAVPSGYFESLFEEPKNTYTRKRRLVGATYGLVHTPISPFCMQHAAANSGVWCLYLCEAWESSKIFFAQSNSSCDHCCYPSVNLAFSCRSSFFYAFRERFMPSFTSRQCTLLLLVAVFRCPFYWPFYSLFPFSLFMLLLFFPRLWSLFCDSLTLFPWCISRITCCHDNSRAQCCTSTLHSFATCFLYFASRLACWASSMVWMRPQIGCLVT